MGVPLPNSLSPTKPKLVKERAKEYVKLPNRRNMNKNVTMPSGGVSK